jgi:poly-beta-1,6-N-acetyl-D-glucosamine synthase
MDSARKYIIISPVRDEERYLEATVRSVVEQTVPPLRYVIVDDGSRDRTGAIADSYAAKYPWITALHRNDRGYRNSAGGEVDAFYAGYHSLTERQWDFIVKLDGDLSFGPDYFEKCLKEFDRDPQLGIGSGIIYNLVNDRLQLEREPRFHVRGAAKMYRRECWENIQGIYAINGWDTLDEVKANMLGWKTNGFYDLRLVQHRPTGMAVGKWKDAVKNGMGSYVSGYHPLYMAFKCLRRVFMWPYLVVAFGQFYGYLKGYIQNVPRVDDKRLIDYLRRQQINKLLLRPTIWR